MATIAEISSYGPGQPIVSLQATVKSCYPPKPFGQQGGTFQNAVIADASGEVNAQFIDVEVYQGQTFMATSQQTTKKELGQERVTWDGAAYTELYKDKFRFTIKKKGFTALAGGPAALAPAPQPPYPPAGPAANAGFPGYPPPAGWPSPPPPQAPGAPYVAQTAPPYAQAAPQPAGASWSPSAALPPVGSAQRPDPAWMTGQEGHPAAASAPAGQAILAKATWQPAPKMGEAEARALLETNYFGFCQNLCRDYGVDEIKELPPEVVAGAMAWSTSLLIAIQRGDVIREPEGAAEAEPWPAAGQAMSPAGGSATYDNATLPAEGPEDADIAFGG